MNTTKEQLTAQVSAAAFRFYANELEKACNADDMSETVRIASTTQKRLEICIAEYVGAWTDELKTTVLAETMAATYMRMMQPLVIQAAASGADLPAHLRRGADAIEKEAK